MKALLLCLFFAIGNVLVLDYITPTVFSADPLFQHQPFIVKSDSSAKGKLEINMSYRPGQNATLIITPVSDDKHWHQPPCITALHIDTQTVNIPLFCRETALNLIPYLQTGINHLEFSVTGNFTEAEFYVSPQLFGAQPLSTIVCIDLVILGMLLTAYIGKRLGLPKYSCIIASLGTAYFCTWLYVWPNLAYTADIPGHYYYIQSLLDNLLQPYHYSGAEQKHPPLYYYLSACVFRLAAITHFIPVLGGIRLVSLSLYMIFCLYGLRTLQIAFTEPKLLFYVGNLLLVFWPVSISIATSINSDVGLYAGWSVAFYYLAKWHEQNTIGDLYWAIGLTGLAFMFKGSALPLLPITGSAILLALIWRKISYRNFMDKRFFWALCFLIIGIILSMGKNVFQDKKIPLALQYIVTPSSEHLYPFSYYLHFNLFDFINHPYVKLGHENGFWNYFLKTMLYAPWNHPGFFAYLPYLLNSLLALFFAITILGTLRISIIRKKAVYSAGFYALSVLLPIAAVIAFVLTLQDQHCQNLRYVLPMIVPLIILFIRSLESFRDNRFLKPIYWLGIATGILLPLGGIVLYLSYSGADSYI